MSERGGAVHLLVGDMVALPFPSASFDLVTTGYGLRNVPDLSAAIDEIHRVLKPGGRMLSLDFNRPANAMVRAVYLTYLSLVGGAIGWMLHRDPDTYRYIPASIRNYPGAEAVARLMESSRLRPREIRSGARRPDGHPRRAYNMQIDTEKWSGEGRVYAGAHRPSASRWIASPFFAWRTRPRAAAKRITTSSATRSSSVSRPSSARAHSPLRSVFPGSATSSRKR